MDHSTPNSSNAILADYLRTSHEAQAKRLLETILTDHALPILRSIQAEKFREVRGEGASYRQQEAEELLHETRARVAAALALRWDDPTSEPIDDFRAYVASVGRNSFSAYVRRKYPNRTALANQVNYELDNQPTLDRWRIAAEEVSGAGQSEWHGGLKRWRQEGRMPTRSAVLMALLADPRAWAMDALPNDDPRKTNLASLLETIFRRVQTPVLVARLVTVLCNLREVEDHVFVQASKTSTADDDPVQRAWDRRAREDYSGSPRNNPAAIAELRDHLVRSWEQIRKLPRNQRVALLLQMRDDQGGAGIHHFPETGIASQRELAAAMELPIETLAECWYRLPLTDKEAAPLLGVTSVQVSSLRKCARERLNWRMADREKNLFAHG